MQPSAPERVGSDDDTGTAALHIRAATEADIPELSKLRYQFRSAVAPAVEDANAFRERSALLMRERLGAGLWFCWVAEDDTGIRGNEWIQLVEKIPTPTDEPEVHAYLTNFFVRERARGVWSARRISEPSSVASCRRAAVCCLLRQQDGANRGAGAYV